jgi:hypothetical protein
MSSPTSQLTEEALKPISRPVLDRQRIFVLTFAVWAVAAALLLTLDPRAIAVAGSLAIGWSHLVGRCGLSHFGALTPRGKLPGQRSRWLTSVVMYVIAGAISSAAVGASLGALGRILVPSSFDAAALALVLLLAAVAAGTELRLIPWRLPQPNLQTRREWGLLRSPIPAVMWGSSLGLTFATVFTFSGTWLILALPFALGEPVFGAIILLTHWFGRAAPVLAGPVLLDHPGHSLRVLDNIESARALFRASNIVGIGLMALSLTILLRDAVA